MRPLHLHLGCSSGSLPLLPMLAAVALGGCGGSTPPAEGPAGSTEVAVVDLSQPPAPTPAVNSAKAEAPAAEGAEDGAETADKGSEEEGEGAASEAGKEEKKYGIIGLLNAGAGDPNAPVSPFGSGGGSSGAPSAQGNMWGSDLGEAFGAGGLGLSGVGTSGGGSSGVGLSGIGGIGSGVGRLGGSSSSKPPEVRQGATSVTGRLAPEVIQRVVRQNFGRFRLCYENGLRNDPTLEGRVAVRFTISQDGAVSNVSNAGSDMPDGAVVSCVMRAFHGLSFPQPEGGLVTVVYPLNFKPGSPAPATKPPAAPPAGKAPAPAATNKAATTPPPATKAPAAPAKQP